MDKEISNINHAINIQYAVLVHVSMDYPPLMGRLFTRYSPVRHFPLKNSFRRNLLLNSRSTCMC